MKQGEKNFINSKDSIYFSIPANLILQCTIIILCLADILLYCLNVDYLFFKGTEFGFVFAILITGVDLLNIIVRLCVGKEKMQFAYYGVCSLLISLYFNYTAFKLGLLPYNQLYGFVGIGVWLIVSAITLYAIKDNITYDRYADNRDSAYYFKEQNDDGNDKKFSIVVTKYTVLSGLVYVIIGIILTLIYLVIAPDKFPNSPTIATQYGYVIVIVCSLILCYWSHFAWKLVVKQFYINTVK